jgi:hypothetical protein
MKDYLDRQTDWVEQNGINNGDTVRVTRKAESMEGGWEEFWVEDMNQYVGKTMAVSSITSDGIELRKFPYAGIQNYVFPYFVLEKVNQPT